MRVLALSSYPINAAATRFRLEQFVEPLSERGIELTISPFLSGEQFREMYTRGGSVRKAFGLIGSVLRRIGDLTTTGKYDVLLVQREAMFFGPAVFEWLFQKIGRLPMVLDLDDATYIRYVSPSYGRLGSALKFFGKADRLIERASLVICGNRFIADYVESKGTRSIAVPTVVDTEKFVPGEKHNDVPVIGWIGTHSTYPFLERLFPTLKRLSEKHKFILKIVGAGTDSIQLHSVEVVNEQWNIDREISDFQSLDIGLYPIFASGAANSDWIAGKSGFKAIQYMAVGVPFVMSPVGVCGEIGEVDKTHFNAVTDEDWYDAIDKLLSDKGLRRQLGVAGREHSVRNFGLDVQADLIANALNDVVRL
ncbi:MAG TPA: glycosyltransferase family 4 protein [Pyrinomonadaceae bacterium]|nr:glycosyltransferase family 4 protein [Pyrinomonadaceae bacterium]